MHNAHQTSKKAAGMENTRRQRDRNERLHTSDGPDRSAARSSLGFMPDAKISKTGGVGSDVEMQESTNKQQRRLSAKRHIWRAVRKARGWPGVA